jgi:feruloyl-CoA synthase
MATATQSFRAVNFGKVEVSREDRPDGTILLRSAVPLGSVPPRLTNHLVHWAQIAPDRVCVARRDGSGKWRKLTYSQVLAQTQNIAQALLQRGLGNERTIVILSENSIEHYLLALAALHVGVPYAPISPPYSLASQDFGKLRHCLKLMTPGLVFAQDFERYARALEIVKDVCPDAEIIVGGNDERSTKDGSSPTFFQSFVETLVTEEIGKAHERVNADTVAKVLFTSGSTSLPKGVINTHGMWCANLVQITQTFPFMTDQPLLIDWLPWNHTFGGNHNVGLALMNGGSLYIDDGKPTPSGILSTVQNLNELAPSVYFNVPKGFEELVPHLRNDAALRTKFFSRLQMIFYAGASLAQPIWNALEELAAQTIGERVPIITGLGMTESGPSAMFANWAGAYSGLLGCPVSGLVLKLVPIGDKIEVRYRGPNVTPGYWRQPELTATAFDEEGFFRTGDAVKFVDESHPNKGLLFDGRIAEDFKLNTGTWVSVGVLRGRFAAAGAGLIQDSVITGLDKPFVGAIVFLNISGARALVGDSSLGDADVIAHPSVRSAIRDAMQNLAQSSTGSSTYVRRALIAEVPPSIDVGEITDKGSLNQRIILKHRAELVETLYSEFPSPQVIRLD